MRLQPSSKGFLQPRTSDEQVYGLIPLRLNYIIYNICIEFSLTKIYQLSFEDESTNTYL